MYPFRVFIKDCLNLGGMPIANSVCLTFTINKDLLSVATSDFTLLDMPTNIKEGDVLGLSDPYGTVLYTGVIKSIGDNIQCRAITSIFNDNWKYHDTSDSTIEGKIKRIIEDDFINSSDPMVSDRFPFTVSVSSSTSGTIEAKDDTAVMDFQTFLMNMYDVYGVITDIKVPFNGTPTIELKQATHPSIKVGNNALPIQNMTPLTEVFETNKLVIYDKEGTTLRGTFYTTSQGITTNANDPLRLPVTKTKFIFNTDDTLNDIKQENLQEEIYNHKITFDLLLNNGLYDFYDWELGMPIEVWYNGEYFNTIFTKYSMSKEMNVDVTSVSITCGKVRNTLTEKINSYSNPQSEYVGSSSMEYYQVGETISFTQGGAFGHLSNNAKTFTFFCPLAKNIPSGMTVAFTVLKGNIRLGNGGYAVAQGGAHVTGGYNYLSAVSLVSYNQNMVRFDISFPSTDQGNVNNTTATLQFDDVRIKFS